jgi:hypothetical protein
VHEETPGRYWFDLPTYKRTQKERFVWSMRVLASAAVVFLIILAVRFVSHSL